MIKRKAKRQRSPVVKTKSSTIRVMVFGTFDLLHLGHIDFFKQAKKLGDILIVSVGRDKNVKKFKGYAPVHNEQVRLKNVKKIIHVNKAVLASLKDPWSHIKREKPDIIALGYDQKIYVDRGGISHFRNLLEKKSIKTQVIRLKPFKPQKYKTSILRHTTTIRRRIVV